MSHKLLVDLSLEQSHKVPGNSAKMNEEEKSFLIDLLEWIAVEVQR
jgi:hypothetical protein